MTTSRFQQVLRQIDEENSKDPNQEFFEGKEYPKELLYSQRLHNRLLKFYPKASEALIIAAYAQHICRWEIARETFPMNRAGYLQWREKLKKFHAETTAAILQKVGYEAEFIDRVSFLIEKKAIKKDAETQILEDAVCLVFFEYYLEPFLEKHSPDKEKLTGIIVKTWKKMSEHGHAEALKIAFKPAILQAIKEALLESDSI